MDFYGMTPTDGEKKKNLAQCDISISVNYSTTTDSRVNLGKTIIVTYENKYGSTILS